MISIVCVYNNEGILKNGLLKSLENQTVEFELVTIDNSKNKFSSAAQALNFNGLETKGKYVMFTHQDVYFLIQDFLEKAEEFLDKIPDLGVAGVAGMRKMGISKIYNVGTIPIESGIGIVYHGREKKPWRCNKSFESPAEVQTLDEQILIVPRRIFKKLKFDEEICRGWHLYGTDYSLCIKKMALKSYVLPLPVWHESLGELTEDYYMTLNRIFKKHSTCRRIFITSGLWYTNNFFNCLNLSIMALRSEIGRCIGRNKIGAAGYIERIKLLLKSND